MEIFTKKCVLYLKKKERNHFPEKETKKNLLNLKKKSVNYFTRKRESCKHWRSRRNQTEPSSGFFF